VLVRIKKWRKKSIYWLRDTVFSTLFGPNTFLSNTPILLVSEWRANPSRDDDSEDKPPKKGSQAGRRAIWYKMEGIPLSLFWLLPNMRLPFCFLPSSHDVPPFWPRHIPNCNYQETKKQPSFFLTRQTALLNSRRKIIFFPDY